ncbi:Extracellular solute-binding protein OS=Streptomyces alboniger OX=132473 GN=CP975_09830 PE=4 SV=1 [Streptomyces alboniger]
MDSGKKSSGKLSGTVTFWDTSNDAEKGTYEKLAKGFEKLHPDVEVNDASVAFGEANAKFKNAAGGNSVRPRRRTEVAWVADFANLGYLAPLEGTAALDKPDYYLPQAAASTEFKGKTYAVPQTIDTLALFYNKKMLKKAGVEVPTTFDEGEFVREEDQVEDRQHRPLPARRLPVLLPPLPLRRGRRPPRHQEQEGQGRRCLGVAAFEVMKDLVDSEAATTDASDGYNNQLNAFKDGDVAMAIDGPWSIEGALQGKEFKGDKANLGVAPVPGGSDRQAAPQGGWNLAAYAGSGNLDASYEFIKYMSSAKVQQQTTEQLSLLPTVQVRLRREVRQGQPDGAVLQAGGGQVRGAAVDPRGQLPLRADPPADGEGAQRQGIAAGRGGRRR